jgi:crotonobetainyl-CoA:carnitine CoA-transferase CaiB-like acyl-CoA transferase
MLHQSLKGARVLDLTRLFPGPLCTVMLADLGAEVIKVEAPEGEFARYMPPYQFGSGQMFLQMNRGKRSMTCNLKKEAGQEILLRLLEKTDILVESFRPGVMKKFRLDYETLRERFPSLIYCSISGFGQQGPNAKKPAHDLNYISIAGILNLSGNEKQGYVVPPVQIADTMGAFCALSAILAAYIQRLRENKGQYLDVSLLDSAFFAMIGLAGIHFAGFPLQANTLPLSGRLACYNVYRTKDDKYLAIAFLEPKFWQTFCLKMKLDQFFNHQLQNDQTELLDLLTEKFAQRTQKDWLDFFQNDDLCISPVLDFSDAIFDPGIVYRQLLTPITYPSGVLTQMRTPFVKDGCSTLRAPVLGEHNFEILREQGYTAQDIDTFKNEGII